MPENFTCQACGGTFKSKQELDAHSKKEHMRPGATSEGGQQKKGM